MALLDSEIARIKAELGYNVLTQDAEPYIAITPLFANVIQQYVQSGSSTTSATAVSAATTPTAVSLTLGSATGFTAGCRVVVDVDDLQETATVRSVSGSIISVILSLAHPAGYPVTVEGGEAIVREKLRNLWALSRAGGLIEKAAKSAGIQKVDEITFFGNARTGASSRLRDLLDQREYYRDELASILNVPRRNGGGGSGGSMTANY